ncbi:hypothetical protein ACO0K9_23055 [Undibacterium sp. Ji50W]|uniref:hypothetical protein n=1 Tax=Undibacterium sp. Ji50W TaxID=3413041 RepID=UPI003BF14F4A
MNTHTNSIVHFPILSRANLVRLNRVLAWAMLVTPLIQFFVHAKITHCLLLDFGLLIAHGILSLYLFGIPKVKREKFTFSMHVMGWRMAGLSPRNLFLLTGYRIVLGLTALLSFFVPGAWVLALLLIYPLIRMPATVVQHLHAAIEYAFQRWGISKFDVEWVVVVIYFYFFIANLLRA